MWMWVIPAILGTIYCLKYWNVSHPPPGDMISPLVILTLAIEVGFMYPMNTPTFLVIIGLLFDAIADFYMNKPTMGISMILFGWGHLIRQLTFIMIFTSQDNYQIVAITLLVLGLLMIEVVTKPRIRVLLIAYTTIMVFTLWNISMTYETIPTGLLSIIVSDLIIAYELVMKDIPHRPFRIIIVPVLFWIGEYILVRQLLG